MKRFWSKVNKTENCWVWTAFQDKNGYGRFRVGDRVLFAHRFSYTLEFGTIPEGLIVRHTCHNTACVNPIHLIVGTNQDNSVDMVEAGRQYSILTDSQVVGIYQCNGTNIDIAKLYQVSQQTVWLIRNNKTWTHVTEGLELGLPITLEKAKWVLGVRAAKGLRKDIARQFCCSTGMVSNIKLGKSYGWLNASDVS